MPERRKIGIIKEKRVFIGLTDKLYGGTDLTWPGIILYAPKTAVMLLMPENVDFSSSQFLPDNPVLTEEASVAAEDTGAAEISVAGTGEDSTILVHVHACGAASFTITDGTWRPFNDKQKVFLNKIKSSLKRQGYEPRTLGETDYDTKAPLAGCRRLILECNGLITVAFRRNKIEKALSRPDKDDKLDGKWTTSSFCQIEPAMAYQLGLPILVFREKDVIDEGVLEDGVLGQYMPIFDLDNDKTVEEYFKSVEYKDLLKNGDFMLILFGIKKDVLKSIIK